VGTVLGPDDAGVTTGSRVEALDAPPPSGTSGAAIAVTVLAVVAGLGTRRLVGRRRR
jgi:hypothetical protein